MGLRQVIQPRERVENVASDWVEIRHQNREREQRPTNPVDVLRRGREKWLPAFAWLFIFNYLLSLQALWA